MHYIGAFGGFITTTSSFWISFNQWYFTIGILLITYLTERLTKHTKSAIWNLEIALIYGIFIGLLYNLILIC